MEFRISINFSALLFCVLTATGRCQTPSELRSLGFQKRAGDEIMVCGQMYHIGVPVKLWLDPGGFDAYRTDRRFAPFDERKWKHTVEQMKEGKIEFTTRPQETSPDRFGMRFESRSKEEYTPEQLDQIRGGGWPLDLLRQKVDQFVLHFDVCGTSAQCFYILHDRRGLSVHFMLDADGTIYQTLDLKERAWHATKSNDRSIGIEIAHIGAYPVDGRNQPSQQWYKKNENGETMLMIPDSIRGSQALSKLGLRPRKNDPIVGPIRVREYQQYDFTPQQYRSLIHLVAGLCDIFPRMRLDAPRSQDGKLIQHTLSDEQWASFSGILGHYHVQENKIDPGPALDWDYLLDEAKQQLTRIRENSPR